MERERGQVVLVGDLGSKKGRRRGLRLEGREGVRCGGETMLCVSEKGGKKMRRRGERGVEEKIKWRDMSQCWFRREAEEDETILLKPNSETREGKKTMQWRKSKRGKGKDWMYECGKGKKRQRQRKR